ncbi:hypothetical protein J4217_03910 [Candidatus Pacearchaeota archaeon]|nr:hypothetical protein [uncultured archaeon]AQS33215.1 hypothetical protein [uncultured archaeon]MBS3091565.1 hypothetical protein [Candidatus Pacearchaeota archaeon]
MTNPQQKTLNWQNKRNFNEFGRNYSELVLSNGLRAVFKGKKGCELGRLTIYNRAEQAVATAIYFDDINLPEFRGNTEFLENNYLMIKNAQGLGSDLTLGLEKVLEGIRVELVEPSKKIAAA